LSTGCAIVVGTPGRIYDHIRRKNLNLAACDCVVLDEADEMLNQGFYEEVTRILDCLPAKKQVLLFSATVPPDIEHLINRYASEPEALLLSGDVLTVEHIHHVRYDLSDAFPKPRNLIYMLELEEPENAIIFCNTKDDTALVTAVLTRNGFDAELLNGDLPQRERERVMAKVKGGEVAFMVATDIAARGIDISDLSHVINYSLPEDPAVYLHRVGRTGRIGKKGTALNLVSGRELTTLTALERRYGIVFEKRTMPSPEEAIRLWTERHVREIREGAAATVYEGLLPLAGQLRQRADADDLVAFLLKYFFTHHRMEKLSAAQQETPSQAGAVEARPEAKSRRNHRAAERPQRHGDRERRRSHSKALGGEATSRGDGGEPLLWINLGKSDGLDAAGLTAAVESAGAPVGKVRRISLRATYSYLAVPEEDAAGFEALTGRMHGQKALRVERAKKRR
ncbi:MAG TPA: DEAD/DEAH box helicase, partial [Myxococcaceae bacterium]|nr:DEAD/DEAH box helicase [Myxococcaceae bacterium]